MPTDRRRQRVRGTLVRWRREDGCFLPVVYVSCIGFWMRAVPSRNVVVRRYCPGVHVFTCRMASFRAYGRSTGEKAIAQTLIDAARVC